MTAPTSPNLSTTPKAPPRTEAAPRSRPTRPLGPILWPAGFVLLLIVASRLFPTKVPPGVVLQGAILGTGTGLLGVGLVLTFRSNRVVNFAYGAMGGLAASVAVALHLGPIGLPWFAAVAVAAAIGIATGFFVELIVIRRFANASRLTLTMATIGLAQVLGGMELLVPIIFKSRPLVGSFPTPLNATTFSVDPLIITGNDLLLVAVVPLILIALGWFLMRTESGIAVRGIAENAERARLLGIPVARLSTIVWCVSGVAAAVTVTLKAPSEGLVLDAAAGPQLLLPALAAAVIAKMESLPKAFVAGVGLGVLDQVVRWNVDKQSTTSVIFLVVILVALMLQKGVRGRAAQSEAVWANAAGKRMPAALSQLRQVRFSRRALAFALAALALALPLVATSSQLNRLNVAIVFGILVISVVLLTGWAGSVSLGQFAIAGVGGVVAGNLVSRYDVDFFVALFAAAAAGALIAVIIGLPALRVTGLFLAVTTLAFAVAMDSFVLNPANFREQIPGSIERPLLWERFDLQSEGAMYYVCLGVLVLAVIGVSGVRRARSGRVLLATRDNERSVAAAGVSTVRSRLGAFMMSGMLAGAAGCLYAVVLGGIGFHTFEPSTSLLLFSMAVIGGMESVGGALLGVALVSTIAYLVPQFQLIITGAGSLLVLLLIPRGLVQVLRNVEIRVHVAIARLRGIDVGDDEMPDAVRAAPAHAPSDATSDLAVAATAHGSGIPEPDDEHAELPLLPSAPAADVAPAALTAPHVALACENVSASYGATQVLFGVDLVVEEGEMVALLGTNGAGKSTLLRCATGLLATTEGEVRLGRRTITKFRPEQIAESGVALMPGGRGLFASLTVAENLRLASWMRRHERGAAAAVREESIALMPILGRRLDLKAGELSGGEQQMLSLAMALATRPEVLCIDELSMGLAPTVVADLIDHVKRVHASGTTVVIVEQSVNVALLLAERAVFLEKGTVRYAGPTRELLERPDVLRSVFVGNAIDSPATPPMAPADSAVPARHRVAEVVTDDAITTPRASVPAGASRPNASNAAPATSATKLFADAAFAPAALECVGLTKRYGGITAVDHVDLRITAGSSVGIVGHNGAGKTTLFDLLSGFTTADAGRILVRGYDVTSAPAHRRALAGLGRSFQEARLYPSLTVRETIAVALDRRIANHDPVAAACHLPASTRSEADAMLIVDEVLDLLGLGRYQHHLTSELSTGTRRIVELAGIIAQDPAVVLLDEPSTGLAQRETEAMGPLLRRVQEHTGCSLVVIEHDMNLITSVSDELVAMELGRVITRGTPAAVLSDDRVIASYLGTEESVIHRSGTGPAKEPALTPQG
jgi:ABC-type branched-subunit amino acid transport system ATPase component/ABC-type branched-subunit amino acid transport system permease subunit